jgi:hypothetical protein
MVVTYTMARLKRLSTKKYQPQAQHTIQVVQVVWRVTNLGSDLNPSESAIAINGAVSRLVSKNSRRNSGALR